MTKDQETQFVKDGIKKAVEDLKKKQDMFEKSVNTNKKALDVIKYGSVTHVEHLIEISVMSNQMRTLDSAIQLFESIEQIPYLSSSRTSISNALKDIEESLKARNAQHDTMGLFTNEYIQNETSILLYQNLISLYTELDSTLLRIENEYKDHVAELSRAKPAVDGLTKTDGDAVDKKTNKTKGEN